MTWPPLVVGPSAGPPVVASRSLFPGDRHEVLQALLSFPAGHPAARRYGLARFEEVDDAFYDGVRRMAEEAEAVPWP